MYEKIKKYWGYIITFFGGIATYFFISSRRYKRSTARLEDRLAESKSIIERLEQNNREFEDRLNSITESNRELIEENGQLRGLVESARFEIESARESNSRVINNTEELSTIGERLQKQSTAIGNRIEQLEYLLQRFKVEE